MGEEFYSNICVVGFVILVFFSLVAIVANGFLLLVVYVDPLKCFRNHNTVFIAALATLDFLSGVLSGFCAPSWLDCIAGKTDAPELSGHLAVLPFQISIAAAIFVILLFSLSRLMAITFPFHYRRFVNVKRSLISVAWVFALSVLLVLLQLCPGLSHGDYIFLFIHVYITFPFLLLVVTSTAIVVALRKSNKQWVEFDGRNCTTAARAKRCKAERTFARTGVLVVLFFSVALLPFYVFVLLQRHCPSCRLEAWYFAGRRLSTTFVLTNSVVNPFLYVFMLPQYRRAAQCVWKRLVRRHRGYEVNNDSPRITSENRYRTLDTKV